MDIDSYIRIVRNHRLLIGGLIAAGAILAAIVALLSPPPYEATLQLYGGAGAIPGRQGAAYEGQRYAEQRMRSYASLLSGRAGAEAVRKQLGLSASVESIRHHIRVSVPPNSAMATITARDSSAQMAKAMAEALARQAPRLIDALEAPGRRERPPLHLAVTSPAQVPTSRIAPSALYLALGGLLGLVVGVLLAVMLERLDDRVREEADVWGAASAPILGRINVRPREEGSPVMLTNPNSPQAEAYRSLRTHLVMVGGEHDVRGFVVSSAVPREGKTEVVANLGLALAQAGERVAVVDANLRAPRLARLLGTPEETGLSEVLAGEMTLDLALRRHPATSLAVLPAGAPARQPAELLAGERLGAVLVALGERFDWVLVDTPALLPVTDALIAARGASGVILVTRAGSTRRRDLRRARQALRTVEAQVLGVVLNGVSTPGAGGYWSDPLARAEGEAALSGGARPDGGGARR